MLELQSPALDLKEVPKTGFNVVAIVGSRYYTDYATFSETMNALGFFLAIVREIHTGEKKKGTDGMATRFAAEHNIPCKNHEAQWGLYGKGAGMRRNPDIITPANIVVAFWDGRKEHCGTWEDIQLALKMHKALVVIPI